MKSEAAQGTWASLASNSAKTTPMKADLDESTSAPLPPVTSSPQKYDVVLESELAADVGRRPAAQVVEKQLPLAPAASAVPLSQIIPNPGSNVSAMLPTFHNVGQQRPSEFTVMLKFTSFSF